MHYSKNLFVFFTLISFAFFAACSEEEDTTSEPVASVPEIALANDSNLGSYLVDQDGRALYFISRDVNGSSA